MKKKFGWTVYGFLGFVFAPMGALFIALGLGLWQAKSARFNGPEERVIFLAVFAGMGGIFLLLGLIFLFTDLRRRYLLRRAYNEGNCVEAQILGTVEQRNVPMVQGCPRMIEAAWTNADGVVHVYRSRYLYTNVQKLLTSDTVPVYIDRYNENVGFVDIDAVLPDIRIH